jgi:hypothetical protein
MPCGLPPFIWEVGLKQEEQIASLLRDLQRGMWANGEPADPATWSDWRQVIQTIRDNPGDAASDPLNQGPV